MIKSILNFFNHKKRKLKTSLNNEKEIYILTSSSTFAGGIKDENDKYWSCGQTFVAYVDCETNELHKAKGTVNWLTEDNNKHPFEFDPKTIYKVKVKQINRNDIVMFTFIAVIDRFAKNEQLLSVKDEFFITDDIADFEFDKKYNRAEGDLYWLGKYVYAHLVNVNNTTAAKKPLLHLKTMVKNIEYWDNTLRTYLAAQTLKKVNNCILDHTEDAIISAQFLKNDAILEDIFIYPNGDFHFNYILKTHHYMINVEGNVNGELKKAYLE